MHRRLETRDQFLARNICHQISAPPPKEKNERKNDEAANAIDRPNTIWIRRRNPPAVSPNARVRPVTMMMITATILDTGPSIDCRICWSGCSHGMFEPAANAGTALSEAPTKAEITATSRRARTCGNIMDHPQLR